MTSSFEGVQPSRPASNRSFPPPPSRTGSRSSQQPTDSRLRHLAGVDANAPVRAGSIAFTEPPSKRQKLDDDLEPRPHEPINQYTEKTTELAHRRSGTDQLDLRCRVEDRPAYHSLAFPIRPGYPHRSTPIHQGRALAIQRASRKDAVPVKAYVPESPSCAPRLHVNGPADFLPWSGHHPEDVLNESTTKQGFYDKAQAGQNESNTARPSVWSSVKHKSGLQILSSLLVSALDQRRSLGTIVGNSTFKPPPRVTLTDTKREAWLRDLANPSIPLRRLSRTIPHGIRGKLLLDHCLSKDIPTSRAIWLVKCVGANEIRAVKRKGTGGVFTVGGEAKWIRDWTMCIEQFLESLIGICGLAEWKAKFEYGSRLASHLFSGHLLDQDHYLNWLMVSIERSDLDHLPIWLLMQHSHHQAIIQHRKCGRQLMAAVVTHLHNINNPINKEIHSSVLQQLSKLARSILINSPACFLLPNSWNQWIDTLRECLIDEDNEHLRPLLESISSRNLTLQSRSSQADMQQRFSWRQEVILLLDSLAINPNYGKVAGACLRLAADDKALVKICIEWSSSVYRHGLFRTYAAGRLLRLWSRNGVQLQSPIFDMLAANPDPASVDRKCLYKLLANLISSKHLSVARYLQWLMARGVQHGLYKVGPDCPCDVGLLLQLPLHGLSSHLSNLRHTLLSSIFGISASHEAEFIATAKSGIKTQLPGFFPSPSSPPRTSIPKQDEAHEELAICGRSATFTIAQWIRENVSLKLKNRSANAIPSMNYENGCKVDANDSDHVITLQEYQRIRRILVDIQEFTILADIVGLLSGKVRGSFLASLTDTVNFYFNVFNAIGAANDLFEKLYCLLDTTRDEELDRDFLESLADLSGRFPNMDNKRTRLREAIPALTSRPPTAAYSPISDTMIEAVQSSEPTFVDELEQLLASGTSMDKQTLTRVFGTVISQLDKSLDVPGDLFVRYSHLLASLRSFEPQEFDLLLQKWLQAWFESSGTSKFVSILTPMICLRITSLEMVLGSVAGILDGQCGIAQKADLAVSAVDMLAQAISERMGVTEFPGYRLHDEIRQVVERSPTCIITILHTAIDSGKLHAEEPIDHSIVRRLAQSIVISQLRMTQSPHKGPLFDTITQTAIGDVLHHVRATRSTEVGMVNKIVNIFQDINEFNAPFSQAELKAIIATDMSPPNNDAHTVFRNAVEEACSPTFERIELWQCLVSELPNDHAAIIRRHAESKLLCLFRDDAEGVFAMENMLTSRLLLLIETSAFSLPIAETSSMVDQIRDSLCTLLSKLTNDDTPNRRTKTYHQETLHVLLRLLIVHQSSVQHPQYSQQNLFHLLITLSLLLVHPSLDANPTLSGFLFDVLSILADNLHADTRCRCIRDLRDRHHIVDPRLDFIFGCPEQAENEWLQLVAKAPHGNDARSEGPALPFMSKPYPLRPFEMMQDATPLASENDTSLSLTLFGSMKSIL